MPLGSGTYLSSIRAPQIGDLAARCSARRAGAIADLGCGPGNSTAVLARRWPARIVGVDNSPDMLERARCEGPPPSGLRRYRLLGTTGQFDLVFSNAALQWVHGMIASCRA